MLDLSDPACLARPSFLSAVLRRLVGEVARRHVALVLLSQAGSGEEGAPTLHHHASLRILVRREAWLHRGVDIVGQRARVTITKNRCAAPHRSLVLSPWGAQP